MKNTKQTIETNGAYVRYIGYGAVHIVAVNPNKDKLIEMGFKAEEEPVYTSKDADGKEIAYIDIYLKKAVTASDSLEFSMPIKHRFFLKRKQINSQTGSVMCINQYGNSTFIPTEHAKTKTVPANLAWFKGSYVVACEGQKEFTEFLRAFFGIPNLTYKNKKGEIVTINNPSDAEVGLDHWAKLFEGDFSEIKVLEDFPTNKVRVMFGIKTTDDNKVYQQIFSHYFGKINNTTTTQLEKQLEDARTNGRYAGVEFSIDPIVEYSQNLQATVVTEINAAIPTNSIEMEEASDDLPF